MAYTYPARALKRYANQRITEAAGYIGDYTDRHVVLDLREEEV